MANYLTIRIRLLVAILVSVLPFSAMKAEEGKDVPAPSQGWYVGVEGGMPFGFSTFSSFGHDKTHLGWAAGLYGGYRFQLHILGRVICQVWRDELVCTRLLRRS